MHDLVASIFDEDFHAKRVASLSNAVVGALSGARLAVATIGRALAISRGGRPRHGIKQVDRFFSNTGVDVWKLFASWVPFVVGPRPEIMVALDWTEFDADNQAIHRALSRDQAWSRHALTAEDGGEVRDEGLAK